MNDNDVRLIDANALIRDNGLENAFKCGNATKEERDFAYSTMMMYEIRDMLDDAPTVETAPKKYGYWDKITTGEGLYDYHFQCSHCGKSTPDGAYPIAPMYCSHCGSDNQSEEREQRQEVRLIDLGLGIRAFNVLYRNYQKCILGMSMYPENNGLKLTLADVIECTPSLERVRDCGVKTWVEIIETIKAKNIPVPIWETEFTKKYQSNSRFRESADRYRNKLKELRHENI